MNAKKLVYYSIHPINTIFKIGSYSFLKCLNDRMFIKIAYYVNMKLLLNIDNPKTYNEKIQWLKLYDRNHFYKEIVDKYQVKKYVSNIIGKDYLIPTIGVWNNINDIDFSILPNSFVLKCTHDSGGVFICKDKNTLNFKKAKRFLKNKLNTNFFFYGREWPYKLIEPRIIAEPYMIDDSGHGLKDYKFFCFNGEPKAMFIATDRGIDTRFDFYDMNFMHLPFTNGHPWARTENRKPDNFESMKTISRALSKGIPHVRVDLYNINGKIYFGEMTMYHWSGLVPFVPAEWDKIFGDWLELPNKIV